MYYYQKLIKNKESITKTNDQEYKHNKNYNLSFSNGAIKDSKGANLSYLGFKYRFRFPSIFPLT